MTTVERQFEMTDGLYTFVYQKIGRLGPDHPEAFYHVPGQSLRKRWVLKALFPSLKDTVREVEIGSEPVAKVSAPMGRPPSLRRDEAIALSQSGLSIAEIARRMDRAPQTVGYWVRK